VHAHGRVRDELFAAVSSLRRRNGVISSDGFRQLQNTARNLYKLWKPGIEAREEETLLDIWNHPANNVWDEIYEKSKNEKMEKPVFPTSCIGVICSQPDCWNDAAHKVAEQNIWDSETELDQHSQFNSQHELTTYLCHEHFTKLMGQLPIAGDDRRNVVKITTDIDTSKLLIAHGVPNEAALYWIYTPKGVYLSTNRYNWIYSEPVAAFTASELGERIPQHISMPYKFSNTWFDPTTHEHYDHEVDARAACLLHINKR